MGGQAASVLRITGDATVVYVAPVDLIDPLRACDLTRLDDDDRASVGREIAALAHGWTFVHSRNGGHGTLGGGQAVVHGVDPLREQVIADLVLPIEPGVVEVFADNLASAAAPAPGAQLPTAEPVEVRARLFANGILSLVVAVTVPDAWSRARPRFEDVFGPAAREEDPVGRAIRRGFLGGGRELAAEPGPNVADAARAALRRRGIPCTDALADIPYFHVIYTGATDLERPGCAVLGDDDRDWVYADGPEDITSMSPHRGEFAYVGYAFTLLVARDAPPPRLRAVVDLVQVVQAQYERLATTCDALERRLSDGMALRLHDLNELEQQASASYQRLATPTFTFDNHVLRLRSGLMAQWGLRHLLERAQHLMTTIRAREQQRRDRRIKVLNRILLVIGLLAVIDTLNSIVSLVDWFSG